MVVGVVGGGRVARPDHPPVHLDATSMFDPRRLPSVLVHVELPATGSV